MDVKKYVQVFSCAQQQYFYELLHKCPIGEKNRRDSTIFSRP